MSKADIVISTPPALFKPGTTVSIDAGVATANIALPNSGRTLRIANVGTVAVFIEFGDVSVAAVVATSMPILPGSVELFDRVGPTGYVAAITASSTARVSITAGLGTE